jgi:hypothetical protein
MWFAMILQFLVIGIPCAAVLYSLYKSIQYSRCGLRPCLSSAANLNRFKAFEMNALYIFITDICVIGVAYIGGQAGGSVRDTLKELILLKEPWCPASPYARQLQDYLQCYVGTTELFFMIYAGIPIFILNLVLFGISIFRARHDNGPNGAEPGFLRWPITYWLLSLALLIALALLP